MDEEILKKLPVKVDDVPSLTSKGGVIKVMISPKTVKATKLIMGTAILQPGEVLVEHVHDYGEEVFFVRTGTGVVYIDDNEIALHPDAAIIVAQGSTHKVVNTGEKSLELIFATAPLAPTAKAGDRVIKEK